jgi:hypothetical protein
MGQKRRAAVLSGLLEDRSYVANHNRDWLARSRQQSSNDLADVTGRSIAMGGPEPAEDAWPKVVSTRKASVKPELSATTPLSHR